MLSDSESNSFANFWSSSDEDIMEASQILELCISNVIFSCYVGKIFAS